MIQNRSFRNCYGIGNLLFRIIFRLRSSVNGSKIVLTCSVFTTAGTQKGLLHCFLPDFYKDYAFNAVNRGVGIRNGCHRRYIIKVRLYCPNANERERTLPTEQCKPGTGNPGPTNLSLAALVVLKTLILYFFF